MSLVLKSNISAKNSLGTYKSVTSTPTVEFNAYKARVLADGGVVMNDADTLAAFTYLINAGIYGIARTFVGAKFGIKRDSNGSVLKLYALDGIDLVAYNINNSALPVTIVNNDLSFNNIVQAGSAQTSGTIFVSEQPIKTNGQGLVVGLKGPGFVKSNVAEQGLAGLTLLDAVVNSSPLWSVVMEAGVGGLRAFRQIGSSPNQNSAATPKASAFMGDTGTNYLFFANYKTSAFHAYRNSARVSMPTVNPNFANFDNFSGYINLGGLVFNVANAKEHRLANMKASLFYLYDNLPESKVETMAKF